MVEDLVEKCPVLKGIGEDLGQEVAELVEGMLGPEVCIRYCYYSAFGRDKEADELMPGVYYENRQDLGVRRIYVRYKNTWVLFEEEPC